MLCIGGLHGKHGIDYLFDVPLPFSVVLSCACGLSEPGEENSKFIKNRPSAERKLFEMCLLSVMCLFLVAVCRFLLQMHYQVDDDVCPFPVLQRIENNARCV